MNLILNKKRRNIFVVVALILLFVFMYGVNVYAGAAAKVENKSFILQAVNFVSSPFVIVISWILYIPIYFFGFLVTSTLIPLMLWVANYNAFITQPGVTDGWIVVRDLANIFVVVGILVIAAGTLFRIESYEYKRLLPKLIMAAILINFSKTIIGFLIDISQVVMLTFVNVFKGIAAGNLIHAIGLEQLLKMSGSLSSFNLAAEGLTLSLIGALILAIIVLVVITAILVVITIYLVARIVMLWIAIVLSPLLFVMPMLPAGQKFAGQIWNMISKYLITGPILAFFLWLSFLIMQKAITGGLAASFDAGILGGATDSFNVFFSEYGSLTTILNFVIVVGLLVGSLMVAQEMGVAGSQFAGSVVGGLKQAGMAALKSPVKLAAFGERKFWKATGVSILNPARMYRQYKIASEQGKIADEIEGQKNAGDLAKELYAKGHTRMGALALAQGSPRDFVQKYLGWQGLKKLGRTMIGKEKTGTKADEIETAAEEKYDEKINELKGASEIDLIKRGREAKIKEGEDNWINSQAIGYRMGSKTGQMTYVNKNGEVITEDIDSNLRKAQHTAEAELTAEYEDRGLDFSKIDKDDRNAEINARINEYKLKSGGIAIGEVDGKMKVSEMDVSSAKMIAKNAIKLNKRAITSVKDHVDQVYTEDNLKQAGKRAITSELSKLRAAQARMEKGGLSEAAMEATKKELDEINEERAKLQAKINANPHGRGVRELRSSVQALNKREAELTKKADVNQLTDAEKKENKEANKEVIQEFKSKIAQLSGVLHRADGTLTNADGASIEDSTEAVRGELEATKEAKKKAMSKAAIAPRTFYADAAYRALEAQSMENVPKEPMEATELVDMIKDAVQKKDKPLLGALLKKAAIDYNDNEFLNGFGFDADAAGMAKFKDQVLKKLAGMSEEMATSLLNEVGYINESKGHYETARLASVKRGVMRFNSPEEHAAVVANENLKQATRAFLQNTNRLGWGGETADGGYKLSLAGKLTLIGMQDDIAYRIPRGEFNQSALQKIAANQLDEIKKLESLGLLTAKQDGKKISQLIEEKLNEINERQGFSADYNVLLRHARGLSGR